MTIQLTLPDDTVLTDEADIIKHLTNEAADAGWVLNMNPDNVIRIFNETPVDADAATHIADVIIALEAEQEAIDADVGKDSHTGTALTPSTTTTKSVSINARAGYAYSYAEKTQGDAQFNEDFELVFKSGEVVKKSKMIILLDLQRMHTDPATNRCEMDDWPRVPVTKEEKEADIAESNRGNNPFAYTVQRNNKKVTRDFAKDYFERTAVGIHCNQERDAATTEKDKLKARGAYKATDMADIEDTIAHWDQRISKGQTAIRGAMILRQKLQRVLEDMPKVHVVVHQTPAGNLADAKSPIRLMPSDPKSMGEVYNVSVASFMSMDVDKALAVGGTVDDLVATNNRGKKPDGTGEEDYGEAKNANDVLGYSFVLNTFFGSPANEKHLDQALMARTKEDKTKYTDDADNLLWQLDDLKDNIIRVLNSEVYRQRIAALNEKNKKAA